MNLPYGPGILISVVWGVVVLWLPLCWSIGWRGGQNEEKMGQAWRVNQNLGNVFSSRSVHQILTLFLALICFMDQCRLAPVILLAQVCVDPQWQLGLTLRQEGKCPLTLRRYLAAKTPVKYKVATASASPYGERIELLNLLANHWSFLCYSCLPACIMICWMEANFFLPPSLSNVDSDLHAAQKSSCFRLSLYFYDIPGLHLMWIEVPHQVVKTINDWYF